MNRLALAGLCALALVPAASLAQNRYLGPKVGAFFPLDDTLRDRLGETWLTYGVSSTRPGVGMQRKFGFDYEIVSNSGSGSRVWMLAVTYGLMQPMGNKYDDNRMYWALRGGGAYVDYDIENGLNDIDGRQIGFAANAELGYVFGDRLKLAARYDWFGSYDGIDFHGFSLIAEYGIFRF